MSGTISLELPLTTQGEAAAELYALLQTHRDQPLCLIAPQGFRLSSGLVQLLLTAAADWQARGLAFGLAALPEDQCALMDLTGLSAFLSGREAAPCP